MTVPEQPIPPSSGVNRRFHILAAAVAGIMIGAAGGLAARHKPVDAWQEGYERGFEAGRQAATGVQKAVFPVD